MSVTPGVVFGLLAMEQGLYLPLQVQEGPNGFFLGTADESGLVSRESIEDWPTKDLAEQALTGAEGKDWNQRGVTALSVFLWINPHEVNMAEITKAAIERLNSAEIEVKLWNGCFNIASVVAGFSRHKFELMVEVTHPLLQWQCGNKQEVSLVLWKASNGLHLDVPDELQPLIERMRAAATMTDEAAAQLSKENKASYQDALASLGV